MRIPEEEASYLSDEQSSNLIQINDQYEKCSLFVSRAFFAVVRGTIYHRASSCLVAAAALAD